MYSFLSLIFAETCSRALSNCDSVTHSTYSTQRGADKLVEGEGVDRARLGVARPEKGIRAYHTVPTTGM